MAPEKPSTLHYFLSYLLLPPLSILLLHALIPGGVIHSHHAVFTLLAAIFCISHTLTHRKASKIGFLCVLLFGTSFLSVLAILFGASPLEWWSHLCWGLLVTSLIVPPSLPVIGYGLQSWTRVFIQCRFNDRSEMCVYVVSLATLMGAWVGAFPILLDWNRPWQVWPIPCNMGALIGNFIGHIFSTWTRFNRDSKSWPDVYYNK